MENKKVLYVTTKNIDYIRNVQIVKMLKNNYSDVKIIYSKKKSYYLRIIEVNLKMLLEKKLKYDIIFLGFLPQLVCSFLQKKRRKDQIIIVDFIISLFNVLVFERRKIREKSFMAKKLKKIDEKTVNNADIVYTDTKTQLDYFAKEFNINEDKLKVLYFEANTDIYNKQVEKLSIKKENEFVVLWFGTVLPLQGVDIILKAAKILEYNDKIKFYIIGKTKKMKINKLLYKNIKFINWLNETELAKYISSSDLCLAGHFSKEMKRANEVIPGKAYIYKAMGKKIILGNSDANREIFAEDNKEFFYVEMGNSQELAEKIQEIWNVARCRNMR